VEAWLLLLLETNWFLLYSGSRTLATTVETALLQVGLACYPRHSALGLAALALMVRPTSALPWIPLALLYLFSTLPSLPLRRLATLPLLPLLAVLVCTTSDSFYYGTPTLTPLTFLRHNVASNLSSFYGVEEWRWYLTHTLPPTLGPLLLPATLGLPSLPATTSLPILSTLATLSFLPHKEMRFLQPILPLLLYSAARFLSHHYSSLPSSRSTLLLLLTNIPLALYLSLMHQQGVTAAALHLGDVEGGALVLMPCHSTPLYSHVHAPAPLAFLTCRPPLPGEGEEEQEVFYRDPVAWLAATYPPPSPIPPNVLLFDVLEPVVGRELAARGLQPCRSWHHSHFPRGRTGARVLLYCRHTG